MVLAQHPRRRLRFEVNPDSKRFQNVRAAGL